MHDDSAKEDTRGRWFLKEDVWLPPELMLLDPDVPFHIKRMLDTAARTAPEVIGGRICCTDIGRKVDEAKFSYHAVGRAVDIRTGLSFHPGVTPDKRRGDWDSSMFVYVERSGAVAMSRRLMTDQECVDEVYHATLAWSGRLQAALGNGHDVIAGLKKKHIRHIHIERDKRDG